MEQKKKNEQDKTHINNLGLLTIDQLKFGMDAVLTEICEENSAKDELVEITDNKISKLIFINYYFRIIL